MQRRLALIFVLLTATLPLLALPAHAQRDDHSLSEGEVEQLRDSAYVPRDRVLVYIKFLDQRSDALRELFAHPRKPGREQDAHDLLEQFTSIANELEDNLDDYSKRHSDIRKSLPKLVDGTERWASILRSLPDNEAYSVSRKLGLDAIRDLHDDTTELIESQKTWFAAHPPPKEDKNAPMDIPR